MTDRKLNTTSSLHHAWGDILNFYATIRKISE